MLIDKDGNCVRKKKKRRKTTYKKAMKRRLHSLQISVGLICMVAAVLAVIIGLGAGQITSRAVSELSFVTNAGSSMSGTAWNVMDGAQIKVRTIPENVDIYYEIYQSKLADPTQVYLNEGGTQYTSDSTITLRRTGSESGNGYLYVQQFEGGVSKRIDCYEIRFIEKAPAVTATPVTSDSEMTTLKIGDTIRFAGSGELFYTLGDSPSFVRMAFGDTTAPAVTVNGENFALGSDQMIPLGTGNSLEVPMEWFENETVTIRVISAVDGKEFSTVANFRYKVGRDQVEKPSIVPATTAENPETIPDNSNITLTTNTSGAIILYTLDGSVPEYDIVMQNGAENYELIPGERTKQYTDRIQATGEPGSEFSITAIAIMFDASTGFKQMIDSEPVQYAYKFAELGAAAAPGSSPRSGTALNLGDPIYLSTSTANAVILYTVDGVTPTYTVSGGELVPGASTYIYGANNQPCVTADADSGAERGKEFLIQAKTVCLDADGKKLMEDSSVVQFAFRINDAETVAAPVATPVTSESKMTVVQEGDNILLSSATAGAKIYYTTNGTAPILDENGEPENTSTILYSGDKRIVVPAGTGYFTVTAIAVKEEMNDSTIVRFSYQYPAVVAPPYCKPVEGTISINTEVELESLDADALIYYTLDGTEPTQLTGKLYSQPLLLTSDTTIKAICILNGISSSVRTFNFDVSPVLMPPTPSLKSGSVVTSGTAITLSTQSGAEIFYTLDGSNPKDGSPMTGNSVTIVGNAGDSVALNTYAKGADYSDSQTATYVYTISNYENGIRVSPENGTKVAAGDLIRLETDVTDGVIYYETGGGVPTAASPKGNQVIVPDAAGEDAFILRAVAAAGGSAFPNQASSWQFPYLEVLTVPKASIPDGAILLKKQKVELTAAGGDIYYTTDGTWPSETSNLYTEAISVDEQMTILAFAMNEEGAKSEVVSFTYSFASQVIKPLFSIQGGEVETGTKLTIRSDTPDAQIYYTLDGTEPDLSHQKNLYTYSGAITITKPVHIKAIAVKDKMTESAVTGAIFTVKEPDPILEDDEEEQQKTGTGGERLMTRRSYMGSSSGPAYTDHVLKNAMTGVVVSAEEGVMPIEVVIEVTEIAAADVLNGSLLETSGDLYTAVSGYEVKVLQNGELITLSENVEVGIPIPAKQRNSAIYLARVDEEGNVELLNTRRDTDMAYAFTNRFGRFCIVAPVEQENANDSSNYTMLLAGGTVLLLAAGYLLLRKARKKGEADE